MFLADVLKSISLKIYAKMYKLIYSVLGKHAVKIQEVIPWPILSLFIPIMITEKPLCFEDA